MAKKVKTILKLQIEAGKATPAPPIGPALGQHGVNIMGFVKEYNEKTASSVGDVIPVEITVYQDNSFSFILKTPPTSALLKKEAGIEKGSGTMPVEMAGSISKDAVKKYGSTDSGALLGDILGPLLKKKKPKTKK